MSGGGSSPERAPAATLVALYRALAPERQRRVFVVAAGMLASTVLELVTISAVLPFLALLTDPARAAELPGFGAFVTLMGNGSEQSLIRKATFLLIGAAIAAAAMRLVILRLTHHLVLMAAHDIGTGIFDRMLHQPYSLYVSRNSAEVLASVEKLHMLVSGVLLPLVQGAVAAVTAVSIAILLFTIHPPMAAGVAATIGLFYLGITKMMHRRLRANSVILSRMATVRMKTLQEALGSMRDILLDGSQQVFQETFRGVDLRLRRAQSKSWFAAAAPRYLVEGAGIALIALIALYLGGEPGGLAAGLPALGAIALGGQRLLPLVQQAYQGAASYAANAQVMLDMLGLLHAPVVDASPVDAAPLPFEREITFEAVGLRLDVDRDWPVRDVSLTIAKGARIGVTGTTGSGKSTFFDLAMGLLEPTSGEIRIDGVALRDTTPGGWQQRIAHVPQSIYLTDSSIAANIAFGAREDEIDLARVRQAATRAQLHQLIEALPQGYDTPVGERGVKLSGGQRQRIAIARALYREASVLILDEATAALDVETEAAVMAAIAAANPETTILVAAHRASALSWCDRIIRFQNGRLVEDEAACAGPRAAARTPQ